MGRKWRQSVAYFSVTRIWVENGGGFDPTATKQSASSFDTLASTRNAVPLGISNRVGAVGLDRARAILTWTIIVATAMRLIAAWFTGASYNEAYYVAAARHLTLSYFDHPPLLMWLLSAAMRLTGSDSIFFLRSLFIVLFIGTTWLMYRLTADLFNPLAGAFAALALNLSILFSFVIGGWIATEGPLMFCLLAAFAGIARIAFGPPTRRLLPWAWVGLWFGLALLSKYSAVLIILGVFIFALTSAEHRRWLMQPGPYLAGIVVLLVFSPVIAWNWQHDWVSLRYQGGRAFEGEGLDFRSLLETIIGQAAVIGPWVWVPMMSVFVRALGNGPAATKSWLLACGAALPILLFTLVGLWVPQAASHLHWEAPGYLFLFPLLGWQMAGDLSRGRTITPRWLNASIAAVVVLWALLASQVATGWMGRLAVEIWPAAARLGDPTVEMVDWNELAPAIADRGLLHASRLFVATTHRYETAKVDTQLGKYLPVLCICIDPRNFGSAWNEQAFAGWDALIVSTAPPPMIHGMYDHQFLSLTPLGEVDIRRDGQVVRKLNIIYAKSFKPPATP